MESEALEQRAFEMPSPRRRPWIAFAIAAFLISQIVIPLSYYLGDEPTSERFAWRMFSSIDLSTWKTEISAVVEENGQLVVRDVPLRAILQESHWKMVERGQLDVVEPLMQKLIRQEGVREVRYVARGFLPSGEPLRPIQMTVKPGESVQRIRDQ